MKKELTLKHGVFLAAAVLLIAGIAFAGAAAADGTITWEKTDLDSAISNGGYYIVDVPSNAISNLYTSTPIIAKNITLDFNYQTVSIGTPMKGPGYGLGGLFSHASVTEGKVITIKNLVIDGGATIDNSMAGAVVGFADGQSHGLGCWVIENVSVKNVSINGGGDLGYSGGVLGAVNRQGIKLVNCSVEYCNIFSRYPCVGGLIGLATSNASVIVENCFINNDYIYSPNSVGGNGCGLLAGQIINSPIIAEDNHVENSIVSLPNCHVGLIGYIKFGPNPSYSENEKSIIEFIGGALDSSARIEGCDVNNCVVLSKNGAVGGIFGKVTESALSSTITAVNNRISSSTIVSTGSNAGGFAGVLNQTLVNSISNNAITNCCVVATKGNAAGFIAAGV